MLRSRPSLARRQEGIALLVTLMVLMLVSALMVGFVTAIVADQRASGLDRDQTQAYAAAHAGLEQLTSDLSGLFTQDFSPDAARISTLTATPPALTGFQFIDPDGSSGLPDHLHARRVGQSRARGSPAGSTISAGPYQGFRGIITPYNITVTARSRGGAEVRMRRTLQTVAVPVFQFGLFSENDLSFFAGPDFNFGGRVHTNAQPLSGVRQWHDADACRPDHGGRRGDPDQPVERLGHEYQLHRNGAGHSRRASDLSQPGANRGQPGHQQSSRPERTKLDDAVGWHLFEQHPQRSNRRAPARPAARVAGRAADRPDSAAGA